MPQIGFALCVLLDENEVISGGFKVAVDVQFRWKFGM